MCEVHKPEKWPEVVQRAVADGGRFRAFGAVPIKTDCLVQVGTYWLWGIKLPELCKGNINFVITDETAGGFQGDCWISPDDAVVCKAEPKEETVEKKFRQVPWGRKFRHPVDGLLAMKTETVAGVQAAIYLKGDSIGRYFYLDSGVMVKEVVGEN